MQEQDLRALESIGEISHRDEDKGQSQTEQENVGEGPRRAARKKTRSLALLDGEAGKEANQEPGNKSQQEQRPGDQQQPDRHWNLNEGREAANPG